MRTLVVKMLDRLGLRLGPSSALDKRHWSPICISRLLVFHLLECPGSAPIAFSFSHHAKIVSRGTDLIYVFSRFHIPPYEYNIDRYLVWLNWSTMYTKLWILRSWRSDAKGRSTTVVGCIVLLYFPHFFSYLFFISNCWGNTNEKTIGQLV